VAKPHLLTSVITATPFRVSFFGGGTDFPGYFNKRGGLVVGGTLRQYSYVALNGLERLLEKRFRVSYSQLEVVDSVEEIRHDIVRATLGECGDLIGDSFIDIHSYADLPSGTGIGSSSAFAVGLLNAIHALNGAYMPPRQLAKAAIHIEREKLGEVGGWQDQILSSFGGFNAVSFHDDDFEVRPLLLGTEHRALLAASCRLYFTSVKRSSAKVQQAAFSTANMADKAKVLDQTLEIAEEALRLFRVTPEPETLVRRWAELLDVSWGLKRSMSSAVSMPAIDDMYEGAKAAGALGGKVIGAGGGGFLLLMAPPERWDDIDLALPGLHSLPLHFGSEGSHIVYVRERP
jgi:D-glycero-alpha-D-manno-heptose-7-phosphate kinase